MSGEDASQIHSFSQKSLFKKSFTSGASILAICLCVGFATHDVKAQVGFEPTERPTERLIQGPTLVQSGFSGAIDVRTGERGQSGEGKYLFIDSNGASVNLRAISDLRSGFNANEAKIFPYDQLLARDVGQIFGLAFDDETDANLYLTASSVFGLPIVGDDKNRDGLPDRLYAGRSDARFMDGLFGGMSGGDPGAIYKVNGRNGQISLFASIQQDGDRNSGAALGNIAYDPESQQLFVSDMETGLVHRLDLDGNIREAFDHGVTARQLAGLDEVAYDPANKLDIRDDEFDPEDPESWGYAPIERRVWASLFMMIAFTTP